MMTELKTVKHSLPETLLKTDEDGISRLPIKSISRLFPLYNLYADEKTSAQERSVLL